MIKTVGRPIKEDWEKKQQVIYYIPKMNVQAFRSKVEPIKKRYSVVPKK